MASSDDVQAAAVVNHMRSVQDGADDHFERGDFLVGRRERAGWQLEGVHRHTGVDFDVSAVGVVGDEFVVLTALDDKDFRPGTVGVGEEALG